MKTKDQKYFNFPVELLNTLTTDHQKALNNILYYSLYEHGQRLEHGSGLERIKASAKYYNVNLNDVVFAMRSGEALFNSIPYGGPKTGINKDMFWDYYGSDRPETDLICLTAFLAIKSIIHTKPYCKVTNNYWLSRMAGLRGSVEDYKDLPPEIAKYANEYQTKKLKASLREWGLVTYSRYTRGFYASFKLNIQDLVLEAEKRRKSIKEKQYKRTENEAVKAALAKLEASRP